MQWDEHRPAENQAVSRTRTLDRTENNDRACRYVCDAQLEEEEEKQHQVEEEERRSK